MRQCCMGGNSQARSICTAEFDNMKNVKVLELWNPAKMSLNKLQSLGIMDTQQYQLEGQYQV